MKIKHSASTPPYKLFCKKALHGKTNFLGQICWGMFYMWTNDQIIQGGKLMVKRFQKSSQVSFPLIDPDLGYWYIVWKIKTTNRGLNFKITFCILCFWGRGFLVKPVFFLKKILVVTCFLRAWGSFTFAYLWSKLIVKWVKALHSESEESWLKPSLSVTLGSNEYHTQ